MVFFRRGVQLHRLSLSQMSFIVWAVFSSIISSISAGLTLIKSSSTFVIFKTVLYLLANVLAYS